MESSANMRSDQGFNISDINRRDKQEIPDDMASQFARLKMAKGVKMTLKDGTVLSHENSIEEVFEDTRDSEVEMGQEARMYATAEVKNMSLS